MMTGRPYVVTGASGRTGTVAAQALLDRGEPVRVVLRDASKGEAWIERGAFVAIADLTDLDAMIAAFSDARAVYIVSPQEYGRPDLFERAASIAEVTAAAAAQAGVPKIVALSSVGAEHDRGTGWILMNRMLEHRLRSLNVPIAFIRAAYFMENWTSLIDVAVKAGTLPSFLSPEDHPFPMVAAADVGVVAASTLIEDWDGERIIDLAGPRQYTPRDVARCLSEAIGVPVEVKAIPETDWTSALSAAGFSEAALRGFLELTGSLNSGYIRFSDDGASETRAGTTDLSSAVSAIAARLGATGCPTSKDPF